MRSLGGFAAIALATVGLTGTASSQEVPPEPEIANWAAPLLWRPPAKSDKEARPGHEVGAGPLSAAGTVAPHLPFVAMTPCRLVDTRPTSAFPANYGAPALVADATRDFDLNSAAHCPGIPADVVAYSLNVTVTQTQGFGDIRIWPTGNFALVSTQNWQAAGVTLANAAIAPAGTDGSVTVQAAGSGTHLIIDINGYFGPFLDLLFVNEGQADAIQPGMIDSDAVASEQIVDGTIVDADISALAAIDDTKISTIASAGKVADSALSSSVTLLGQTIEGGEITNITRSISIPLLAFMDCDTGSAAFLDFTSGAADRKADFTGIASGAEGFALHFDNDPGQEDQNTEICSQLVLPPDYVSGGQFRVLMQKGGHAGATETLNCAVGGNTSGIGGQGAVITTTNVSTIYTCAPPLPSLQAGDTLRISLKMTSDIVMDDLVLLYSVAFEYTASQ